RVTRAANVKRAERVDAEVSLVALEDQLLEAGTRTIAIHYVIERLHRRRIGGAPREQIAIPGLGIEQRKQLIERRLSGLLRNERAAAVADAVGLYHRGLHRGGDVDHVAQRGIHEVYAGHDIVDGIVVSAGRRQLRVQADGHTAVDAETGIGGRLLAGAELALQVIKLRPHLHQ